MSITYQEIFESNFLDQFKENKEKISKLKVNDDNFAINVDKIVEYLGLNEKDTVIFDKSGQYNSNGHTILVNVLDSPQRQRFTKAHEIGHAVLGHTGKNGISNRDTSRTVYDADEVAANKFAAELLMPKKLIIKAIEKYQRLENIRDVQKIDVDDLIKFLAKQLDVSMMSMKYRLLNLKIIVYGDSSE